MPKARRKVPATLKQVLSYLGQRGGRARAKGMTADERTASASQAAASRWANTDPAKRSRAARKAAKARWAKKPKTGGKKKSRP